MVQFGLCNAVVRHQEIKLGRGLFRDFTEIEEGDTECLRDFRDGFFIFSREPSAALLVEQLEDAHQIFVVRHNGVGQNLFCLESGSFVVGSVMEE